MKYISFVFHIYLRLSFYVWWRGDQLWSIVLWQERFCLLPRLSHAAFDSRKRGLFIFLPVPHVCPASAIFGVQSGMGLKGGKLLPCLLSDFPHTLYFEGESQSDTTHKMVWDNSQPESYLICLIMRL